MTSTVGLLTGNPEWYTPTEHIEAARRLADLRNDGLVKQGAARKCAVCWKACVVWVAVHKA